MKILHLTDHLFIGGKERQLVELIAGLEAQENIECQILVLSDNIHYPYLDKLKSKLHIHRRRIKKDPTVFLKLYRICRDFRPDIIQSWELMCSIYALPIAKILGIKFINGAIVNAPVKLKIFDQYWIRSKLTFPFSDVVLANSRAGLKAYNVSSRKGKYIHAGFNFSRIKNINDKNYIREKYNISTEYSVGMVASFTDKKDYGTFISAAMRLLQKREDVTFITVGSGPELEKFKKMIKEENTNRIKFLGKIDDVEPIINIFDVGVLATYTEGISNTIMEYMALGKPVIATDGGGTGELVVNNQTGYIVKVSDVEELAQKIEFILDHKTLGRNMGNAGKKRLMEAFSLEVGTNNYINLYKDCIQNQI